MSGAGIGPVGRIVGGCSWPCSNSSNDKTIVMAARSFNILSNRHAAKQPLVSASRRNDDGEHVHVKFFLKTEPELAQPLVLSQIGWLLTSHGTLVFDPCKILNMINHFLNQDRLVGRRRSQPIICKKDGP